MYMQLIKNKHYLKKCFYLPIIRFINSSNKTRCGLLENEIDSLLDKNETTSMHSFINILNKLTNNNKDIYKISDYFSLEDLGHIGYLALETTDKIIGLKYICDNIHFFTNVVIIDFQIIKDDISIRLNTTSHSIQPIILIYISGIFMKTIEQLSLNSIKLDDLLSNNHIDTYSTTMDINFKLSKINKNVVKIDNVIHNFLKNYLSLQNNATLNKQCFTERVKKVSHTLIRINNLSTKTVAKELNISIRSLQDKLRKDGFSFREIKDETIAKYIDELLQSGYYKESQFLIALGYKSKSSLDSLFKKLKGKSFISYILAKRNNHKKSHI